MVSDGKAPAAPDASAGAAASDEARARGRAEEGATLIGQEAPAPLMNESPVACLVPLSGEHRQPHSLASNDVVAGRSAECSLVIDHRSVSRKHAHLTQSEAGVWSVTDLGSSNGTFVNGEKLAQARSLSHGDVLRIGSLEFKFLAAAGARAKLEDVYNRSIVAGLIERLAKGGDASLENLGADLQQAAAALVAESKKDSQNQEEFEQGLAVARAIQDSLIPSADVLVYPPFQIAGFYRSASVCGGDWWLSADLGDKRILVIVGDVTGHGLSAAMITATAKGCCDAMLATVPRAEIHPGRLLHVINDSLCRIHATMTCFACVLDLAQNKLTFANGGHTAPFMVKPGAEGSKYEVLVDQSDLLGRNPKSEFREVEKPVAPGSVMVLYSDGLIECTNKQGRPFGRRRLLRSLEQHAPTRAVTGIRDAIIRDALAYAEGQPLDDDLTLLVGAIAEPSA